MTDRLEALTEVTLAIARAAAAADETFAGELGTTLRLSLRGCAAQPALFAETLSWLERFEGGQGPVSRQRTISTSEREQADGTVSCSKESRDGGI
jgi:hypothetical protein